MYADKVMNKYENGDKIIKQIWKWRHTYGHCENGDNKYQNCENGDKIINKSANGDKKTKTKNKNK